MSESFVQMFVMVQPSQRRLDQVTCESPLDNTLIVLGGEFAFIYLFECVEGVLVGDYFRLGQVGEVYRTTTLTVLRGKFPKYMDFSRF